MTEGVPPLKYSRLWVRSSSFERLEFLRQYWPLKYENRKTSNKKIKKTFFLKLIFPRHPRSMVISSWHYQVWNLAAAVARKASPATRSPRTLPARANESGKVLRGGSGGRSRQPRWTPTLPCAPSWPTCRTWSRKANGIWKYVTESHVLWHFFSLYISITDNFPSYVLL